MFGIVCVISLSESNFYNMKKIKLLAVAMLFAGSSIMAQGAFEKGDKACHHHHQKGSKQGVKYNDCKPGSQSWFGELNLSEQQKTSVKKVMSTRKAEIEKAKSKYSAVLEQMKSDFKKAKSQSESGKISEQAKNEIKGKYHSQLKPMFEEIRQIKDESFKSIQAMLTPEQKAKMKELKEQKSDNWKNHSNPMK